MDNILSVRAASIFRYYVVETADMPLGFFSSVDVKVVATVGCGAIPLGVELLTIEYDIALPACLVCTLDLEGVDLAVMSEGSRQVNGVSALPELLL